MSTLTHFAQPSRAAVQRALLLVLAVALTVAVVALTTAYVQRAGSVPPQVEAPAAVYPVGTVQDPCATTLAAPVVAC